MRTPGPPRLPASILLVLHVENYSGPQRSLTPRLESLMEQGVRITTLVPQEGPAADYARSTGRVISGMPGAALVPRTPLAMKRVAGDALAQAAKVEEVARESEAELVIVSSARMPGALAGARRAGAATLLYAGELLTGTPLYRLLGEPVGRFALQNSDAIVVPSSVVGRWYRRRGGDPQIVHPAIGWSDDHSDREARGRDFRRSLGIGPSEVLVSSLGAITRGRGQDVLVHALAHELARGKRWRLVVGGEPYNRPSDLRFAEELRQLPGELGVSESVTFAGRVDDAAGLYAASDVFVNPARIAETFGRAACEALAAGCPVVTTHVGGVAEALRPDETALFVNPDDPHEIGQAVTTLIEDPSRAKALAARGQEDVRTRFAPEVENASFEDAVVDAVSDRGRATGPPRRDRRGFDESVPSLRSLAIMHLSEPCGPSRSLDSEFRWLAEQGSMEILIPGPGRIESEFRDYARVRTLEYTAMMVPRSPLSWFRVSRRYAKQVSAFRRAIRDASPDLIVVTSVVLPTALLAARLEGVPTILYAGEILDEPRVESRARKVAGRFLIRLGHGSASAIVACSDRVGRQYASRMAKVVIVNPSIGPRYARGEAERFCREHEIANGPLIVAVGALSHGRGQDVLVRALPRIQAKHPNARLAIVGAAHPRDVDREFEASLVGLANGIAPESITFTGFQERVEDAYAAADVVVNPARYESFGRVAFEAIVAGRPVVSTTAGGIPDVLRDGDDALLVPPDDAAELGDAVSRLLAEPDLAASLVASGQARVERDLQPEHALERFKDVVHSVLR
ncbi:MAG TPA: glycosyltransferase family 4 protein [Solirubrobacterales bacterium]|nr:glycosyltransferase family 4 protein [Solirubrobacterales bacterium]